MQEYLVIYLHATDLTRPGWAVVDAAGTVRQHATHATTEGLAQIADGKHVIVLVPAEDVLLTALKLPKMSRSRLLQAIPYALEEQLIDDIEQLHFAPGDYQASEILPVAVVKREKMQAWMTLLQSWQIKPDALVSAVFGLPAEVETWSAYLYEMAVVRSGDSAGWGCDTTNFIQHVNLALTDVAITPQLIRILNYTNHEYAKALNVTMKVAEEFLPVDQFIANMARGVIKTTKIDLLQGHFVVKKNRLPQMQKVWKTATYLAAGWIALLFFYPMISALILGHRVNVLDDEIHAIYKRHFPQAASIVAPKMRMEEKLNKLSAEVGENRLLVLLGYVGKGMLETESVKLKRFDYQNNQLTIELTAANSEDFSNFADFLTRHGLNVKQQNANLAGARISATLQVE